MKVALVTGSVPPATCGVGDYTIRLAEALREIQIEYEVVTQDNWGIKEYFNLSKEINKSQSDIVHIQYPTVGYRTGMAPHILAILCRKPVVTTLHEFKHSNWLRKISCILFSIGSKIIIFTNAEDQENFKRIFSGAAAKSTIIRIGSNIPWLDKRRNDKNKICYFGIIRPDKGLEEFIELSRIIHKRKMQYSLNVIGTPAVSNIRYYNELREKTACLPIEWSVNFTPEQVALRLQEAACAYLPFPGGASIRRGSLMAVMGNGVPVVTTDGPDRPPEMAKAMRFASNPEEALSVIVSLMNDPAQAEAIVAEARKCLVNFAWPKIAEDHKAVYDRVLGLG